MKKLLAALMLTTSVATFAAPNFECNIFNKDGVSGTFSLSGNDPSLQTYKIKLIQQKTAKSLTGKMFHTGNVRFRSLPKELQKSFIEVIKQTRRPDLKTGDLVSFSNTKDINDSTLSAYLMPSGEVAFLEIGVIQVFCI